MLLSADSMWSALPLNAPREWIGAPSSSGVAGVQKALAEEHAQFEILNSEGLVERLADYKVLLIPEQCILSAAESDAIRRFVRAGGALIATGETGTRDFNNRPLTEFSIADVLGVRFAGRSDARRAYLRAKADLAEFGIPPWMYRLRALTRGFKRRRRNRWSSFSPNGPQTGSRRTAGRPGSHAQPIRRRSSNLLRS